MPRKRNHDEMTASEPPQEVQPPSMLQRIRNTWEFASVMQYIFFFGKVIKIDEDFDIEDFETECLKPGPSEKLEEIGLQLLKWISSHRGLSLDIWDEYTRRQYISKAPHLNPYGDDEEPKRFRDFDVFQKLRVLHQLTVWTLWNPDRIRERMPDQPREIDQTEWRIEELGYDRDERQYYVLDDNRLYRRTEPPLPPIPKAKPKYTSMKAQAARRRVSKRRKIQESATPEPTDDDAEESLAETTEETTTNPTDTFGGFKWECIAINLKDYQELCESLKKTRDPNEKILRDRLLEEVIPIIEAAEERQRRKIERRERELITLERMAGAKRSSRIADKTEREKRELEAAEMERKRLTDLAAAHREQERQEQMENERRSRMMTREQRIKDREFKRLLMEEELVRDAEEQRRIEFGEARGSERHLKERIQRNKKELDVLVAEDEWTFDCSGCGVHGKNIDDGSHSVACERCNVWQHSKCLGISKSAADKEDFHFICGDCRRKEEEAKRPKISLKFRLGTSSSPPQPRNSPPTVKSESPKKQRLVSVELPAYPIVQPPNSQPSAPNGHPPNPSASLHHRIAPKLNIATTVAEMSNRPVHPVNATYQTPSATVQLHGHPLQWQHYTNGQQQRSLPAPNQSGFHQSPPRLPNPTNAGQFQPGRPPPAQSYQTNQATVPRSTSHGSSQSPTILSATTQQTPNGYTHQPLPHYHGRPSPAANPPVISPTQGNYDVGPVAGIQQRSTTSASSQLPETPLGSVRGNGTVNTLTNSQSKFRHYTTPAAPNTQSSSSSQNSPPLSLSGLSPVKQRSPPLPPPSHIPQKVSLSMSPPPSVTSRSVSGTPIYPPTTVLAPRPEQIQSSPVPTPSKNPTPAKIGADELKRVSLAAEAAVGGVAETTRQQSLPEQIAANGISRQG